MNGFRIGRSPAGFFRLSKNLLVHIQRLFHTSRTTIHIWAIDPSRAAEHRGMRSIIGDRQIPWIGRATASGRTRPPAERSNRSQSNLEPYRCRTEHERPAVLLIPILFTLSETRKLEVAHARSKVRCGAGSQPAAASQAAPHRHPASLNFHQIPCAAGNGKHACVPCPHSCGHIRTGNS